MASKLIEELIINVKQKGAKPTEKAIQKIADSLEDAAAGGELLQESLAGLPKMLQLIEKRASGASKSLKGMNTSINSSATIDSLNKIDSGIDMLIESIVSLNEDTKHLNNNMIRGFDNLANSLGRDMDRIQDGLMDVDSSTKKVGEGFTELGNKARKAGNGLANSGRQGRNSARTFSDISRIAGPLPDLYAKIAANAFVLSEAFRLLASGEQLNRLKEAGDIMSTRVGVPISNTAAQMRELTGNTLSFGMSMKQASAAVAYGFDSKQIEQLTMAARRASVALGIDMEDAMNRAIKGASKLEPELLDELGITTKLTTAYQRYAAQIGVSAQALNAYQQRAAIVNEINSESVQKFGDLDEMLSNGAPWEKFGANAKTALQDTIALIAEMTSGIAEFFNQASDQTVTQKLVSQVQATFDTYQASGKAGQRSGMFGSAAELLAQKKQLEGIETTSMAIAANAAIGSNEYAKAWNEAHRAGVAIEGINKTLIGIGSTAAALNKGADAYKNLRAAAAGTTQTFTLQLAAVKGQTTGYNKLYDSAKELSDAFNLVRKSDPGADLSKTLSMLNFSSEKEMNSMVALTKSYRAANIAVQKLSLTKAKLALASRSVETYGEWAQVDQLNAQLKAQSALYESSRRLGAQSVVLAKLKANMINTNIKLLDTKSKIAHQDAAILLSNIQNAKTSGRISGLEAIKNSLDANKFLLADLKEQNATYDDRLSVMREIAKLQAEETARENQRKNEYAQPYLGSTTAGAGIGLDDKQVLQTKERAETYTSSLGQLTSQVDGLGSMTSAFQTLTLAASGFGDTASSALQLTSVGLNGFAGMLKMTSNAAVSSISAQIQMEQKRDGKSKESQEKIKQLEAKKIKVQQKAAQQQILISTAVAVMNAASNPWPFPAIPLMATAALAGGMALSQASSASSNQMAGLNADSATSAASLTMGDRSNSVNVAGSANSGELSYIRGDKGSGSIGSFTPRAEGGPMSPGMGYIVGENGPEVISPVQKMQATSNNDATNSGSSNGNGGLIFSPNIQAMDAQSIIDRSGDIFEAFRFSAEQQGIDIFKLR